MIFLQLLEAVERKVLLDLQQQLIDVLPDDTDVTLKGQLELKPALVKRDHDAPKVMFKQPNGRIGILIPREQGRGYRVLGMEPHQDWWTYFDGFQWDLVLDRIKHEWPAGDSHYWASYQDAK